MIVQSVRFRITLLYTGILTLTLLAFSLAVYQNFSRSLAANLDGLLKSKAEGVSDSIETFWETEGMDGLAVGARAAALTKLNNINFLKIAQRWIEEKSEDPTLMNIIVQVFDAGGGLVAASKNVPEAEALFPDQIRTAALGKPRFYDREATRAGAEPLPLRLFLMPVLENGRLTYIVQVSSSLAPLRSTRNRLKTLLFLILPLTVILTGLAGLVLVRLTLKPVDKMVRTLGRIESRRLDVRLPLPRTHDEIRRLAETFNDLLDRLAKDFLSQQQFSQDLSHELRTPLTVLKGELEVTLKKFRSQEDYEALLKSSREEIDTINNVLDQLLMLARWDNREIPLRLSDFDLRSLVEQVTGEVRVLADLKNIRLNFESPARLSFNGDEKQFRTVLVNLLDNAIKYSPPEGTVDILLKDEDGATRIIVRDRGRGIPEDKLPYIFDRFYRVEDARSSAGFGLGLSIARAIVEAHGGTIKVASRPGFGTAFTLSFPKIADRQA